MIHLNDIFNRERESTMQVQHPLPDGQGLGPVHRQLRGAQVSMQGDDGPVLERRPLLADLQSSTISDQDVFSLQLDISLVKHQGAAWIT